MNRKVKKTYRPRFAQKQPEPVVKRRVRKTFLSKVTSYIGTALILIGLLFLFVHRYMVAITPGEQFARDIFGLPIPTPPEWTSFIPFAGGFLAWVFEMLSLHGVLGLGIFVVFVSVGWKLIDVRDESERFVNRPQSVSRNNNAVVNSKEDDPVKHLKAVQKRITEKGGIANFNNPERTKEILEAFRKIGHDNKKS